MRELSAFPEAPLKVTRKKSSQHSSKKKIEVGAHYLARVDGKVSTVKVEDIRGDGDDHCYDITVVATNLHTTLFLSTQFLRRVEI
jgi:hypothetical protein